MLLFLLGLVVGGILGIALICILSAGSMADEQMELMRKKFDQFSFDKQNIVTSKH
jgi:gas vesicle protein